MSIRFAVPFALVFASLATSAMADATIKVSLWDKGPDSLMMDDAHMAMMAKIDPPTMPMATMGLKLDQTSVAAGKVTFEVVNDSKDIIHEMILAPIKAGAVELPYVAADYKVDEDAAGHLGEVSELDPGKGGSLTIDLKAGNYVVFCNIPGHFVNGMWTLLTVTP